LYAGFSGDYARSVSVAKGKIGFIEPMLAVAVTKLPEEPAWTYELKFDGYRALGIKASGKVRLLSRNGRDFTRQFASGPSVFRP
jgi:ATP-dependent DNA ligase